MVIERWDGDTRGAGICDGAAMVSGVRRLAESMLGPTWVAEDPETHLLPGLRSACEEAWSPFSLRSSRQDADGVFVVTLEWHRDDASFRALRSAVFALVGRISEQFTHVAQHEVTDTVVFEVTTGVPDGFGEFGRGHGHLVRILVEGEAIESLVVADRQ
jgi:hypothetical protein